MAAAELISFPIKQCNQGLANFAEADDAEVIRANCRFSRGSVLHTIVNPREWTFSPRSRRESSDFLPDFRTQLRALSIHSHGVGHGIRLYEIG
jgi:hypothetical protein